MATYYVAPWGNDNNDGLTWETAKKSFGTSGNNIYLKGEGFYTSGIFSIYGKPYSIVDGNNANITSSSQTIIYIYNTTLKNFYQLREYGKLVLFNSTLNNIYRVASYSWASNINYAIKASYSIFTLSNMFTIGAAINDSFKNTCFKANNIYLLVPSKELIIANSQSLNIKASVLNSLFINSKFKFTGGDLGTDETDYTYPSGSTDDEKLQNLRSRMATVYGGDASQYLKGCKYYSRNAPDGQEEDAGYVDAYKDVFIDADNDNFYLRPDVKTVTGIDVAHMAWDGSYIGAKPVGYNVPLADMTLTNIDANGKITDQETDALAVQSTITDLGSSKRIDNLSFLGERAARNGQQINEEANLSAPISASSTLTAGNTYMCIDDTIHLDGSGDINGIVDFNPWESFRLDTDQTFSTSGTGKVQQVYIDNTYEPKVKLKCSKTDDTLASATEITLFAHETPMVNLDANGEPTAGNADASYDEATAQPLYTRYLQFTHVQVKANNIPSR